jgi:polysaccharide export outer membrane protein
MEARRNNMRISLFRKKSLKAIFISISIITISAFSLAQDLSVTDAKDSLREARELCSSMTESNKSLAKSAGYDIEKLCSGLEQFNLSQPQIVDEPLVLPRDTYTSVPAKPVTAADDRETSQAIPTTGLKTFGYDLFAGEPTSFEPASRIPVSPNYLLGPGDIVKVLFYGKVNKSYELQINRDGSIEFPQLGPVSLVGLTFSDARKLLQRRIKEETIGVETSISLGELRSMQVFMLGEAYKPGSYTISALSTMTNALFLSGGVSDIASLRNVQLKRVGQLVSELDLYDLLLNGDTSNDVQLQSGDTIYIPTVGKTASVNGEVRRPAIYELKGTVKAKQLVDLAGGLTPRAFTKSARIHRIGSSGFKSVVDIDLNSAKGQNTPIQNGDLLVIDSATEQQEMVVSLSGHVYHPSQFLWQEVMRISDVVKSVDSLKPNADLDFALITRRLPPVGKVEALFVDLRAVLANPNSDANISLLPRDELTVFSNNNDRTDKVVELVKTLKLQSRSGEMARVASIGGTVRFPGEYPLTIDMTLTQLIEAAGGLKEEAYTQVVELSRHDFTDSEKAGSDHFAITLSDALRNPQKDPLLKPYDVISVRTIPEFRESNSISLIGEVRFPGQYRFKRGEKLSEVIKRAGGLTELAHTDATVFTRKGLREQEARQLEELRQRMRTDIAASGLEKTNEGKSSGINETQQFLAELESAEAIGRLVINLAAILDNSLDDIILKDGDQLFIPEYRQEISVVGEIQHPSSHLFNGKLDIDDYIDLSGGVTRRADSKRIYVVKADGSVSLSGRSDWFRRRSNNIEPGDTIIVPLDLDRRRNLTVWGEASAIVYQLALGAAAIKSF